MAKESRKSELIAELDRARRGLATNVLGLRRDLDLRQRVEAAYRRHSVAWITGASALGFILARVSGRAKRTPVAQRHRKSNAEEKIVKAGLLLPVLKIAFDLSRPVLTRWLTQRVADYAANGFGPTRRG